MGFKKERWCKGCDGRWTHQRKLEAVLLQDVEAGSPGGLPEAFLGPEVFLEEINAAREQVGPALCRRLELLAASTRPTPDGVPGGVVCVL